MRPVDFDLLYQLEDQFWWFAAMRDIADTVMSEQVRGGRTLRVCDAGCGTGINLGHYQGYGHDVSGFDIAAEAVRWVQQRGFTQIAQASVTDIPFADRSFDLVCSFEVICQVPGNGDAAALREMYRILKPGGFLFIRLPALEWLRSSHDEELHTHHRYYRTQLVRMLQDAGFDVRFSSYANSFLFPVVLIRRLLKRIGIGGGTDVKPLPKGLGWLNPVFRSILRSEARIFRRRARLPIGLSVLAYAVRPKN